MLTSIIEFTALVLLIATFFHAAKFHDRAFAQQWFIAGYLTAILRETILQTAFQTYFFPPDALRIGAAPALVTLLSPILYYLSYQFALRLSPPENFRRTLGLIFLIAASIAVPLEATAALARWWVFDVGRWFLFGAPAIAPLIWGGGAALFYAAFARVHATNLPERGKLYAMIVLASVIAALQVIWILLLGWVG